MASEDTTDSWTWAAMEPEPTEKERALYDLFCHEFLVDRNHTRAAMRCGFQAGFAADYGKLLFQKSYVQRRLAALERAKPNEQAEREFDAVNTRARLRSIVNDETQRASARVSAAAELNRMHGLHAPTKLNVNQRQSGVMLMPVMSLDEWERDAVESQRKLMEDAGA